jgi:hypothetical protein
MQPSTYAVCQAAKWLKSSALRLSDNSRRANFRSSRRGPNESGSAVSALLVPPKVAP